jgi:hypothetical protein
MTRESCNHEHDNLPSQSFDVCLSLQWFFDAQNATTMYPIGWDARSSGNFPFMPGREQDPMRVRNRRDVVFQKLSNGF